MKVIGPVLNNEVNVEDVIKDELGAAPNSFTIFRRSGKKSAARGSGRINPP